MRTSRNRQHRLFQKQMVQQWDRITDIVGIYRDEEFKERRKYPD